MSNQGYDDDKPKDGKYQKFSPPIKGYLPSPGYKLSFNSYRIHILH